MRINISFVWLLLANHILFAQQGASAIISGRVEAGHLPDTITLRLFDEFTTYREAADNVWERQVITHDGSFSFQAPVSGKGYSFSLTDSRDDSRPGVLRVYKYPINACDSLHVIMDVKETLFSGRGSEKLTCFSRIMKLRWARVRSPFYSELAVNPGNLFQFFNALDYAGVLESDVLQSFIDRLDTGDYYRMKADIEGGIGMEKYRYAAKYLNGPDTLIRDSLLKGICGQLSAILLDTVHAADHMYADHYVEYAVRKAESDHAWGKLSGAGSMTGTVLDLIRSQYAGGLRDKIILEYLNRRVAYSEINDRDLQSALQIMDTGRYADRVRELYDSFGHGSMAVNFEFKDRNGNTVRLSDFRGKVVFMDLWFSGCSGCVSVANALPGVEAVFTGRRDVVFVSVSIDTDHALWLRSITPKGNGTGRVGYSHFTTASTQYLYTGGRGSNDLFIQRYIPTNTYPHLLLIDRAGRIYAANPPRPDLGEGRRELIAMIGKAAGE
jgi:hypothetical protein